MELNRQEIRAICLGKFSARKCPACDNDGREYYDGRTGLGAGPMPPDGIPEDDIASEPCANCDGVGYILKFEE
jgi:hypothetical protein